MEKRKIVARICAFLLAASLITIDAFPVSATGAAGNPEPESRQGVEGIVAGEAADPALDAGAKDSAGPGMPVIEEPDLPNAAGTEMPATAGAELPNAEEVRPNPANPAEPEPTGTEGQEPGLLDGTGQRPDLFEEPEGEQGNTSGIQEKNDGLIYQDGVPYNGYYMDNAGVLHFVTNGLAVPKTGTVPAGTEYYSCQEAKIMALQSQAIFVEGKTYRGYYIDTNGILYFVTNGVAEPKNGIVPAGAAYYSCQEGKAMSFLSPTVFVGGKAYTGYYMDTDDILYQAANGLAEPKTGMLDAGTEYYSSKTLQETALKAQTLYVEGKVYSGYYMDPENKMHYANKGTCTLKTGVLKAGTKYYSYNEKKALSLPKQALYVEGKVYSGYYMDRSGKMYNVAKGVRTLKTGSVKAGAQYYSYNAQKALKLSKKTLYVKGKVYSGYYMGQSKKMYYVKKGAASLKTGTLKAGARYYSYNHKKTLKLSKKTLYVKGKVYSGYFMSHGKKMYYVKKGASSLKTGIIKAGAKYYSYNAKKTLKFQKETLYVRGKAYSGSYMDHGENMYSVRKGVCTLKTGMLEAGEKYYSYNAKKTLTLQVRTLYVEGKVYSGYYLSPENKMYLASGGTFTPANTTLNAGTAYFSSSEGKMLTLPAQAVYVDGRAMEGMSPESLETLKRAQAVVASITNDSMAKEEKLRVCFDYVKQAYQESKPRIPHYKGMDWPVVYANDMFLHGTGNCCSYAAAFAYMAKAIGYEEVYCCNSGGHGWAEIDGLVYDPEWSKWHHVYNYFALSYDTPTDQDYKGAIGAGYPWMRIKI